MATCLRFHVGTLLFLLQRKRKLPPGPLGLPLFGYLPFVSKAPHLDLMKLSEKYGNVFGSCERHPRLCNIPPCCRERPLKEWLHVPHPDFVLPSQYLRPPCEDVCCNHPVFEHRGYIPRCIRCSHFPPPQLRFNYSTEDGNTDPKSELATYETVSIMALGTVVIGGGSGFIGKAITRNLRKLGYDVVIVSRQPGLQSMSWNELDQQGLPSTCTAVLNVAGQNVLDPTRRWTPGFQQNVYASRINTTKLLADKIQQMPVPPKVFGTISGVGFYKPSATAIYTEESEGGNHDYFSKLCASWEQASELPLELKVRRFVVRSGVVLGRSGGMISQIFWPFFLGAGGPIGSGNQFFPWIHIEDIAGLFTHGIQTDELEGTYNGVAPQVITNKEFTKAFARAMWRPAFIPLPAFAVDLAFGGERAIMMTEGQQVIPKRTLDSGYKFVYPRIEEACKDCAHVLVDKSDS